ncbi:FAS1-like dehydratase domain-containing protein [Novosphingobium lentum]|uniref:FAS1-like dehydratase domain-containing protein n=1 Tax=Novosphingobium lentum TaxID=145287 RepID=UPI0008295694|nr:MaoC family dehydratase N-terminal domain-containing protein [Novosphingobium lentum]
MTGLTDEDIAMARAAIGRSERRREVLDTQSLRRFSVAIGGEGDVGGRRPVLAHWAWFLPTPLDGEIGADGHPLRGGFLPAIAALPRRMFAATAIRFEAPLLLDAEAEAVTRIADVRHKAGRTGELVFVDIERSIAQRGAVCVTERQTLVYRAAGDGAPLALPTPDGAAHVAAEGGAVWTPSTVQLFRFSAVTFNGHRIHYDRPYATAIEGYPALIVHGPFVAAKLAEMAAGSGVLAHFAFRAQAPCFVDQPIRLGPAGDGAFHAIRCDGAIATVAQAGYR